VINKKERILITRGEARIANSPHPRYLIAPLFWLIQARFPQFYSRIGFVHESRPLDANQVQELLALRWAPAGIKLPEGPLSPEVVASLIRMTGGNFRLLTRLLTQIERVLSVNDLHHVSVEVVEAARDSLVIGTN
jgi:hypothetical protein